MFQDKQLFYQITLRIMDETTLNPQETRWKKTRVHGGNLGIDEGLVAGVWGAVCSPPHKVTFPFLPLHFVIGLDGGSRFPGKNVNEIGTWWEMWVGDSACLWERQGGGGLCALLGEGKRVSVWQDVCQCVCAGPEVRPADRTGRG